MISAAGTVVKPLGQTVYARVALVLYAWQQQLQFDFDSFILNIEFKLKRNGLIPATRRERA